MISKCIQQGRENDLGLVGEELICAGLTQDRRGPLTVIMMCRLKLEENRAMMAGEEAVCVWGNTRGQGREWGNDAKGPCSLADF